MRAGSPPPQVATRFADMAHLKRLAKAFRKTDILMETGDEGRLNHHAPVVGWRRDNEQAVAAHPHLQCQLPREAYAA